MQGASRTASIAVTIGLHIAVAVVLLQIEAVRRPLLEAMPMMVDLIVPPRPEEPPSIEPPKPLPVARAAAPRRAREPTPLIATESAASGSFVTPPSAPPVPVTPAAPVAIAPPVVPPSFDAAYLRNPPPAYPMMSRRRGEQGIVILRVYVDADGSAQKVLVRTSSGYERLDQAAHDAVHQWRFVPARQGEQAIAAWVLVPIRFALEN